MKTKEARKILKDQLEKNPKPNIKDMEELASLVSWEQKRCTDILLISVRIKKK